jgi:hypothetical protein
MRPGIALLLLPCLGIGCSSDGIIDPSKSPPVLHSAMAVANPANALSALVILETEHADSVRIGYAGPGGIIERTPFQHVRAGLDTVHALGLRASTIYSMWIEAIGHGGETSGKGQPLTTPALPPPLGDLHLVSTGTPTSGYTMIVPVFLGGDAAGYVLIFDSTGTIAWYHTVHGLGFAVEAKQQVNGNLTVYVGRSYGWQPVDGRFLEIQPDGQVARTFTAAAPFYTDPHELLMSFRGTELEYVHLIGYEIRQYDVADPAGGGRTSLAIHRILRQSPSGDKLFEWNASQHFSPADWPPSSTPFDLVHPSSLVMDPDGNYVASFQAMDEIDKIDAATGETLWRFGGRHSDFVIDGDPLNGFQGQHSVRVLPNGNLLLFDNRSGPDPLASRAVEYELDHEAGRARMVWQFRPDPSITSRIMGSVQRLLNGNTVVGFGVAARVIEVSPGGAVVADGALVMTGISEPVQFYRAIRIGSLYGFEEP